MCVVPLLSVLSFLFSVDLFVFISTSLVIAGRWPGEDSQVTALGATLQSNTHLIMLELARNGLDDAGVTSLAAGLQANPASAMTSLKLTHGNQGVFLYVCLLPLLSYFLWRHPSC